jgi:hypothetical protein
MGQNATVVVMMDAVDRIRDDPRFGYNLYYACLKVGGQGGHIDIQSGGHLNAATVVDVHHADYLVPVIVGGNTGRVISGVSTWIDPNEEEKETNVRLLKAMAEVLGYRVSRIRK